MNPLDRAALISAEIDAQDARTEPAVEEAGPPVDAKGASWVGVWLEADVVEEALTETFRALLTSVRQTRETISVADVAMVMAFTVGQLEKHLSEACADQKLGLACARLGLLAHVEGAPVDTSPMGANLRSRLH